MTRYQCYFVRYDSVRRIILYELLNCTFQETESKSEPDSDSDELVPRNKKDQLFDTDKYPENRFEKIDFLCKYKLDKEKRKSIFKDNGKKPKKISNRKIVIVNKYWNLSKYWQVK